MIQVPVMDIKELEKLTRPGRHERRFEPEPEARLVIVRTPMSPKRIEARTKAMEAIFAKILRD